MRDILVCNTSASSMATLISAVRPVLLWTVERTWKYAINLVTKLEGCFSLNLVPTWMTSNTVKEADFIRTFIGGQEKMIQISGSDSPARFTGAVIRKIAEQYPEPIRKPNISTCSAA